MPALKEKFTDTHPTPSLAQKPAPLRGADFVLPDDPPDDLKIAAIVPVSTGELMTAAQVGPDGRDNWDPPVPSAREVKWRHGHWQATRDKVREAIVAAGMPAKRVQRWDSCGACSVVEYSREAKKWRITCWHCKDRMCGPCQRRKAAEIAHIIKAQTADRDSRLITLTLAHRVESLRDSIRRLRQGFNKLKRSKFWRSQVTGGIAVIEVKRNPEGAYQNDKGHWCHGDGLWHAHFHIVTNGVYINSKRLSEEWFKATGDSYIVDIRFIKAADRAAYYLSKYVTKPASHTMLEDPALLQELVIAMRGQRAFNVFGAWLHTPRWKPDDDVKDWKPIGSIDEIMQARDRGDRWAVDLCSNLQKKPAEPTNQDGP